MFSLLFIEIVKLLIEAGSNINKQDNFGYTALIYASIYGHIDIVKLLIEAGVDINIQDKYGNTALMIASINGYTEIVKLLKKAIFNSVTE